MQFNEVNYEKLPIFLFCDIVHDFSEGSGISGDFETDLKLITYLCNKFIDSRITPELIKEYISSSKKASSFINDAHEYLYGLCKRTKGKYFLEYVYNGTNTTFGEIQIMTGSFEEVKSDTGRFSGIGNRAEDIYQILRAGGKGPNYQCTDTPKNPKTTIYIIEDAVKSDKFFGYIYDTNTQVSERKIGDYYTASLNSVSGIYDQASSQLRTKNVFVDDNLNFIRQKDPGFDIYRQNLTENISFSLNYTNKPINVELIQVPKTQSTTDFEKAISTFMELINNITEQLRQQLDKQLREPKYNYYDQIQPIILNYLKKLNPLLQKTLNTLLDNEFLEKFKKEIRTSEGIYEELLKYFMNNYILKNYTPKQNKITTLETIWNKLTFSGKYENMDKYLINTNEKLLIFCYNLVILNSGMGGLINNVLTRMLSDEAKIPLIDIRINGISFLNGISPSVKNMRKQIRLLLIEYLKKYNVDINPDIIDDIENDRSRTTVQSEDTYDHIQGAIIHLLNDPENTELCTNIMKFILAKTFGDFAQIYTVLGLNRRSFRENCGFPIWFLTFDQMAGLTSLYLGANTLLQTSGGMGFSYYNLRFTGIDTEEYEIKYPLKQLLEDITYNKLKEQSVIMTGFGKKKKKSKSRRSRS